MSRHKDYQFLMSSPLSSENSCSRLSPHITFGTISIRDIVSQLNTKYNDSDMIKNRCHHLKKDSLGIVTLSKNFMMNLQLNIKI